MPKAIQKQEKTRFTPGPWAWGNALEEVDPHEKKPSELVAYDQPDSEGRQRIKTVVDLDLQHEMRPADANLIAAAPDLFEALKLMIEGKVSESSIHAVHPSKRFCKCCGRNSEEYVHSANCPVRMAELAIAKAEGLEAPHA